ncbi:MAG: ribonuclease H [Candidatus Portnoybacteria bacterium CG23_combo_of_CG06-09_8_20_14_all_37_13]|uniref:Ribonuclease H n=1 Tax=Candidatus Portnoybacteria bacterium CG23_combo_of_CG06-09_8_20_14_all_37_13 TaxID=1974819 RepID=A0A2G9YDU4_9BACT|nr:MAG: ribonuclease H [Candidatus Portnoybacteria bacterium CG23_combo_of_CG06-09_8_20_14_all_37_13]
MIKVFTDGGARGNPGPAAIGVVIGDKNYSKYIGRRTNNQAEYEAIIFALEQAKKLKLQELEINLDSELACKQLNREYKVKDKDLQPLFIKALNLSLDFQKIIFKHIPREQNKKADKLVNQELKKQCFI